MGRISAYARIFVLASTFLVFTAATILAAEKLKVASSQKIYPGYYLPIFAAEERGYWKENGLEVEWVPFAGSAPMFSTVAAGHISFGLTPLDTVLLAASRGIPVLAVGELVPHDPFLVWVRADSRFRESKGLKGARIGLPRLGVVSHAYGQAMAKALGFEKDIKFIALGGMEQMMAGLKMGSIDAIIQPLAITVSVKLAGEVREIGSMADFLPKERIEHVIFAQKDFTKKNAEMAKRAVKAVVQGVDFARKNPAWSLEKMRAEGVPTEGARLLNDGIRFTSTGKIDRKAIENVRAFLIEYKIIPEEKTPPVDELFSREFTG